VNNPIINQLIGSHRPFVSVKTLWTIHGTDTLQISNTTRCGNRQEKNRISHNFYNITKMLANMSTRAFVMHVTIVRAVSVFFLLGRSRVSVMLPYRCLGIEQNNLFPARQQQELDSLNPRATQSIPELLGNSNIYTPKVTHRLFHSCG
jgi:hypothetical protein